MSAAIATFSWHPRKYGILHDCNGAHKPDDVAEPWRYFAGLDNAYTAELYTAWVALTTRGPLADPSLVFRSSSWHFADCKRYITAQEGEREPDDCNGWL